TGFRMSLGGAQQYFNVNPDLSVFAKAMGSGYPISAVVGKRKWMNLIQDARVIHAGTMNAGNPTIAAALATIGVLETQRPYERMFYYGQRLMDGLRRAAAAAGQNLLVQGPGPMFHMGFTQLDKVRDYRGCFSYDKGKLGKFIAGMHDRGVR